MPEVLTLLTQDILIFGELYSKSMDYFTYMDVMKVKWKIYLTGF